MNNVIYYFNGTLAKLTNFESNCREKLTLIRFLYLKTHSAEIFQEEKEREYAMREQEEYERQELESESNELTLKHVILLKMVHLVDYSWYKVEQQEVHEVESEEQDQPYLRPGLYI
ncbi:7847_t:CDS:2 [Diversispora eburnea]|uniref:7847_t:CDS:1 n=1 Tax=Diversispora eburnea TaxID=1213867 RepID=A0A9N9BNQ7_9GLOM|nr:7847_t:CDS:2 [Diversispora eburnea]